MRKAAATERPPPFSTASRTESVGPGRRPRLLLQSPVGLCDGCASAIVVSVSIRHLPSPGRDIQARVHAFPPPDGNGTRSTSSALPVHHRAQDQHDWGTSQPNYSPLEPGGAPVSPWVLLTRCCLARTLSTCSQSPAVGPLSRLAPAPSDDPFVVSAVSAAELQELYQRFTRLDRDYSGTLSVEELLSVPEFAMNPLDPRIIEILNLDEQELDFTNFARLLSIFHVNSKASDKLKCRPPPPSPRSCHPHRPSLVPHI